MLQNRGRRPDSKITIIVACVNIAMCLFGVAPIVSALLR
jgi:hypothetical protein